MNEIVLQTRLAKVRIDRGIYGHFSEHLGRCIYEGYWVGEDSRIPNVRGIRQDVVRALRRIKIPVLRWPGGCFADEYHWMDGIGLREKRPTMINTHWGGVVENNHFGTHEFMDLCAQLGCEPYICGNVGSGTVQEMSQWVEYMTFDGKSPMADLRRSNGRDEPWRLKYFGVGNENWGCGGRMRSEYYADLYRRYSLYARNYGENRLYRIACGPRNDDYHWTEVLMEQAGHDGLPGGPYMDGLALHYYTSIRRLSDGSRIGSATQFDEAEWIEIIAKGLFMDELIRRHATIMDKYDPEQHVALIVDEWGTWYAVEPGTNPRFLYQQNSMRDAIVAATTLDIFNNHCDRVRMANIAQTCNVLQAMVLTDQDKMIVTPSYHVFDLYAVHQDALMVPVHVDSEAYSYGEYTVPAVSASASIDAAGSVLHLTLSNANPHKAVAVQAYLGGMRARQVTGRVLRGSAMNAHNTFENPDAVAPIPFDGARLHDGERLEIALPSMSVVALQVS